ncbi:putative GTPase [Martiniozyma asiatica (nom. inval.)]|nr:putative GTPase [Martiniozyma asiatica]
MPPKKVEPKKWKPPKGPKNTPHKDTNKLGLGRQIKHAKTVQNEVYYLPDGQMRFTTEKHEADWVKLRSVVQENALDEFLNTAQLADTDFTAEKHASVKIIRVNDNSLSNGGYNPYLLTKEEENKKFEIQKNLIDDLTVPRRPKWDENTTKFELERLESESFLDWRRHLAMLQENNDLLLTPFERNIMVWKQLWRVVERSDLVVQIVDARNPLLFRSNDLEKYVKEIDSRKRNLLLVNKADLLSFNQRLSWAKYFKENGIEYTFFSAAKANEILEKEKEEEEAIKRWQEAHPGETYQPPQPYIKAQPIKETDDLDDIDLDDIDLDELSDDEREEFLRLERELKELEGEMDNLEIEEENDDAEDDEDDYNFSEEDPDDIDDDIKEMTHIVTVEELESLLINAAPEPLTPAPPGQPPRVQIGLVGYPNVGKSSTINALVGSKKVSVSSTPGKTKHFQTILLSDDVILCDCPGLVFPNFAYTNAELVCNGVLPIDQLREYTGPAELVCRRVPKWFIEAVYGIRVNMKTEEEGGHGRPTSQELLTAYARARGYMTQGFGSADESRAARYVLKDVVNGKLLFVEPPPIEEGRRASDEQVREFNKELYTLAHLPQQRRDQLVEAIKNKGMDVRDFSLERDLDKLSFSGHVANDNKGGDRTHGGKQAALWNKSDAVDDEFFTQNSVKGVMRGPFHKMVNINDKKHNKANKKKKKKEKK